MTASSFTVGPSGVKRPRLTAGITSAELGERAAKFSTRDAVRLLEEALKSWDAGDRQTFVLSSLFCLIYFDISLILIR
uniref:Uncharacterized protein n=1 Tax=Parascaris equorum TaxID=6256 RepID=A0A914RHS2_PAREQ